MPEAIISCHGCSEDIYRDYAHPFEDNEGKLKQLLCEICCPNCWGGTGNGPTGSQRSNSRERPPKRQTEEVPVETELGPDLD